tara:strand:+ start:2092 stop:2631 length:540 start_codon:yes stop_codon:yes gene_type:complete
LNIKNLIKFFLHIENLKTVKRKGWIIKSKVKEVESVAEHSYAATSIAMIISDLAGLNTEKVMKMMLIHDLPEGIIGDLVPGENANKESDEEEAIRSILGSLPDEMRIDYTEIWNEFKMKKTKESQLVHEIDKLELIIQLSLYRDRMSKEAFNEFLQSSEKISEFDLNRELLNEILKEIK